MRCFHLGLRPSRGHLEVLRMRMDPTGVPEVCQAAHTFNLPRLITQLGAEEGSGGGKVCWRVWGGGWGASWLVAATVSALGCKKGVCIVCVCVYPPHPARRPLTPFFHSRIFPTLINTFQYPTPTCQSRLSFQEKEKKEGKKTRVSHERNTFWFGRRSRLQRHRLRAPNQRFFILLCSFFGNLAALICGAQAERSWEIRSSVARCPGGAVGRK